MVSRWWWRARCWRAETRLGLMCTTTLSAWRCACRSVSIPVAVLGAVASVALWKGRALVSSAACSSNRRHYSNRACPLLMCGGCVAGRGAGLRPASFQENLENPV